MKVDIYSDIACPFCYVGKRRFERALAAYPGAAAVEVAYQPYQLQPDAPLEAESMERMVRGKFGDQAVQMHARLSKMGAGEGINFDFAAAQYVNTLLAHRLLHLAKTEHGAAVQAELNDALLHEYFVAGGNVGDRDRLTELAVAAGLDRGRVSSYLASDEGSAEVRQQIAEAQSMGITAVPTFVFEDKWAVQGAQEVSTFLQALEQVAAETGEAAKAAVNAGGSEGDGSEAAGSRAHEAVAGDSCADDSCAV